MSCPQSEIFTYSFHSSKSIIETSWEYSVFVRKCQTILKAILVDQFPYYSSDISHLLNPRFLTKIAAWLLFCIFDGMAVKTNNMICCFRNPVDLRYMYLKSIVLSFPHKHKSLTWSAYRLASDVTSLATLNLPTSFPGPLFSASYLLASTQNTPKLSQRTIMAKYPLNGERTIKLPVRRGVNVKVV